MLKLIDLSKLTIGSDPEFFVSKDGKIVSSVGIIPGDKDSITDAGDGYAVFKDNVLVEWNIPATYSKADFIKRMTDIKTMTKKFFNVDCISKNSHEFTADQLDSIEAKAFGCADYNLAWKGEATCAADLSASMIRTAGFHIHIGYTLNDNDFINKENMDKMLAKAFDYFCIIPSRKHMPDAFRDVNYGALGTYRNKPYGVEVRGLGAYFSRPEYLEWVYDRTIDTIKYCSEISNLSKLMDIEDPLFTSAEYKYLKINTNLI